MASKIIIAILTTLLLLSNAFWLYESIDSSVSQMYRSAEVYQLRESKALVVGMLEKELSGRSKLEITTLASQFSTLDSFEKDGCLWVGGVGFKFNAKDELEALVAGQSNLSNSQCNDDPTL